MLSCARATRGLRRPSLDTRSGRPSSPPSREKVGERGRSMRAIKGNLATPLERCRKFECVCLGYWHVLVCQWVGG
jgi:hypothetical protein